LGKEQEGGKWKGKEREGRADIKGKEMAGQGMGERKKGEGFSGPTVLGILHPKLPTYISG